MTRLAGTLIATMLVGVGPWGGCDREPVTPPATPPLERAPFDVGDPVDGAGTRGIILLDGARRRG
jgi:hypothetical protein